MKRHRTASTVSIGTPDEGGAMGSVARHTQLAAGAENARTRSAASEPRLVLASERVWTHTLVLTGELNHRSAHVLETEIERACDEGVTGITLDLRQQRRGLHPQLAHDLRGDTVRGTKENVEQMLGLDLLVVSAFGQTLGSNQRFLCPFGKALNIHCESPV